MDSLVNSNKKMGRMIPLVFLLIIFSSLMAQQDWTYDNSLVPDIKFWKDVFTLYQTNQYILHDSEDLRIIYKIVTFDSSISEYAKEKQIERMKKEIKDVLLKFADHNGKITATTVLEEQIGWYFNKAEDPSVYKYASQQIRAQQGMRETFEAGLARALYYIPIMKQVFREKQLPEELSYLPHIESSFNPIARSKVGAAGMWQFMRSTGRRYMKVNRIIDQRYDPIVSTKAAAKLLRYNYDQTGDWGLAVTAYNFGLSGIKRAIQNYGSDYLKVRESFNHRKFKFASRNFYPELLAVIEIMKDYKTYFSEVSPINLTPSFRYQLKKAILIPSLVQNLGIDMSDFKALNPEYTRNALKGWVKVPSGYWINLPIETDLARLDSYFRKKELTLNNEMPEQTRILSTEQELSDQIAKEVSKPVLNGALTAKKPGVISETSSKILTEANLQQGLYGISVEEKVSLDKIEKDLYHKLEIKDNYITVFANETLGHYADWLKIPLSYLQNLNHFRNRRTIYQGQRLKIDFSRVTEREFLEKRVNYHIQLIMSFLDQKELVNLLEYEIAAGESLWNLSKYRYNVPMGIIQYFNIYTDINNLYPGDVIRIPIFHNNNSLEETL
jgi:membrane-bound lytic murein transglycosylase D